MRLPFRREETGQVQHPLPRLRLLVSAGVPFDELAVRVERHGVVLRFLLLDREPEHGRATGRHDLIQ